MYEGYDVMRHLFWYNVGMPNQFEKKDVPLPMKVTESIKLELERIAIALDRPVSYVARELMLRGLGLYEIDGLLRDAGPEKKRPLGKRIGEITKKENVK
jgi:hypothetical protein